MTEENYKEVLSRYAILKKQQEEKTEAENKLKDLWKEKTIYESDSKVQKYKQIVEDIEKTEQVAFRQIPTEDYIFNTLMEASYKETNGIYVYMGTYIYASASWNSYNNVELCSPFAAIGILRKKSKTFEEENIVLFPPQTQDSQEFYNVVKRTFFKYVVEFGQEEAVQKVIEEFGTPEQVMKRERRNNKIN